MPRQNRSFSQTNPNNATNKSLLQESEVVRLQKDIDNYTRKVELERRRYFNLSSIHQQLKGEINDRTKNVAELKKEQIAKCQKKDVAAIRSLQKQIDQYNTKYDQSLSTIEDIRGQIDLLRKQRSHCLEKMKQMEQELKDAEENTQGLEEQIHKKDKRAYSTQQQMYMLKTKNEEEKSNYQSQFKSLQSQVIRERDERDKLNKSFNERRDSYETFDTSTVLRRRLQRLILNNKEKVKIIDAYQRNMRIIDEGFNQIKEATGLTDIEEIQSNFIKSEEQNYALLTYLDILNQEIDNIEDLNSELEIKCSDQERENIERKRILQATPDEEKRKRRIQKVIDEKSTEVDEFQKELDQVQPMFQTLLSQLVDSKFNILPNRIHTYKEGFQLNEGNIDSYLAELEDFVGQILLYKSKKNQPGMYFTSTLLIDEIPYKEFKPKQTPVVSGPQGDEGTDQYKLLEPQKLREQAQEFIEKRTNIQYQSAPVGSQQPQSSKKTTPVPQSQTRK